MVLKWFFLMRQYVLYHDVRVAVFKLLNFELILLFIIMNCFCKYYPSRRTPSDIKYYIHIHIHIPPRPKLRK